MLKHDVSYGIDKGKQSYLSGLSAGSIKIIKKTNLNKAKSEGLRLHILSILCNEGLFVQHKINNFEAR